MLNTQNLLIEGSCDCVALVFNLSPCKCCLGCSALQYCGCVLCQPAGFQYHPVRLLLHQSRLRNHLSHEVPRQLWILISQPDSGTVATVCDKTGNNT